MKFSGTRERIKSKSFGERKQDTGRGKKDATLSEAHGRKEIRGETTLSKETLSDEVRLKLVECCCLSP